MPAKTSRSSSTPVTPKRTTAAKSAESKATRKTQSTPTLTKTTATPPKKTQTGWDPAPQVSSAMSSVGSLAPANSVNVVTAAQAVSPSEALKLVKNGDIDIVMPLGEGDLNMGIKAHVRPNTVMKISAHVKDGVIDFKHTNVKFDPPMDVGPMGNDVSGAQMTSDGRIRIDLNWLPDPKIGSKAPAKLSEFVDYIQNMKSMPVKMLGVKVYNIKTSSSGSSGSTTPTSGNTGTGSTAATGTDMSPVLDKIDASKTTISIKNVSFNDGVVPMGSMGRVQLGADSKLEISGTLNDLTLKGHASLKQLDLDASGTHVKGTTGSADISVNWSGKTLNAQGTVKATLSNFNLTTESAVSRRENGDFIELAKGSIQQGSLTLEQEIGSGSTSARSATLDVKKFQGTISNGQITVPDGDGTATIKIAKSTVSGSVHVDGKHILVNGDVELHAELTDFQAPAEGMNLSIASAKIDGKTNVVFDTETGIKANGSVRLQAKLDDKAQKLSTDGQSVTLSDGSLDVTATKLEIGKGGELNVAAKGKIDIGVKNAELGQKGMSMKLGESRISGSATVNIGDGDFKITNSTVKLKASVNDGKVNLGDNISLDVKKGTSVQAALKSVAFGKHGTSMQFGPQTKLDAVLDKGTVRLPNGQPINFKSGTRATFQFDKLVMPDKGIPEASGKISINAALDADQIDLDELVKLPGVSLNKAEGVTQTFKLDIGRFDIKKTGEFNVDDVTFGIEASIKHFGGVIH